MDTYFAPVQRTDRRKFKNQISSISQSPVMNALLQTAAGILVILNEDRQIVALNHVFLEKLGIRDINEVLGFRLGESLNCIHAHKKPAGCGTTEFCPSCGAAIAMMSAIRENKTKEQICALVSDKNGKTSDICLRVKAEPIQADGQRWIVIYAQDITQEQFWANLDHVFFHDINNTLTSLYGHVQLCEADHPGRKEMKPIREAVERLINEVAIQKKFSQHKDVTYIPVQNAVSLKDIKKELDIIVKGHRSLKGKRILENWGEDNLILTTDVLLLSRTLGNMVINALEATPSDGFIRVSVTSTLEGVTWQVWNKAVIPGAFRKRIFHRHFSSKSGSGRGFGTYSMKLFSETYLKGKVSFTSSEKTGTIFTLFLPFQTTA
ncbi:sensor histidine kinase [Desulfospira joergensenii]|uniref:sensor histidine kinase n=1 Tax=Desulfospira joergensenii TaxID=53329 RepID=UPI0003B75A43|nr:ATP-binding protein [Desulfospira joergensenii]